ncbi:hypothetical protein, partial [Paenibacillus sp. P46E]|uniref:hypothetical protein n=1 Tax=Paenibacillus sp. P46E TaxID=1349436 RepID=UPI00116126E5
MNKITITLTLIILSTFIFNTGGSKYIFSLYNFAKNDFNVQQLDMRNAGIINTADFTVDENLMDGIGQSGDPSLTFNFAKGEFIKSLSLNITVTTDDVLQMFFVNQDGQGFNEIESLKFNLIPGDNFVELKIPISYAAKLMKSIRIDPIETNN